jgi:hypothetical protein
MQGVFIRNTQTKLCLVAKQNLGQGKLLVVVVKTELLPTFQANRRQKKENRIKI